jgi:hypothetical protein
MSEQPVDETVSDPVQDFEVDVLDPDEIEVDEEVPDDDGG